MNSAALFQTVFLACAVEAVEATTVVLAMGTARNWRSALAGVAAGLLLLAGVVAVLGPAISAVPLDDLRLLVGGVLLIFGLQWLRKAVLRASGHKALHDEDALFRQQLAAAQSAAGGRRNLVPDGYGFTVSFKSVDLLARPHANVGVNTPFGRLASCRRVTADPNVCRPTDSRSISA